MVWYVDIYEHMKKKNNKNISKRDTERIAKRLDKEVKEKLPKSKTYKSDLLSRAEGVLESMKLLKEDAEFNSKLIDEWCNKMDKFLELDTERKNKLIREVQGILHRLRVGWDDLVKCDEEYRKIREETMKVYNDESILPVYEKLPKPNFDLKELLNQWLDKDDNEGEEWKQG